MLPLWKITSSRLTNKYSTHLMEMYWNFSHLEFGVELTLHIKYYCNLLFHKTSFIEVWSSPFIHKVQASTSSFKKKGLLGLLLRISEINVFGSYLEKKLPKYKISTYVHYYTIRKKIQLEKADKCHMYLFYLTMSLDCWWYRRWGVVKKGPMRK